MFKLPIHVSKKIWILIGLLICFVTGAILVNQTQRPQTQESQAAAKNAHVFILPSTQSVTGEQSFQVWVTSDAPVVFVRLEIPFDRSIVNLSQEIELPHPTLSTVVTKTSKSEANSAGRAIFVIAYDPTKNTGGPTGSFQIATLKLSSNTTQQNRTMTLEPDLTLSQFVAFDQSVFSLTKTGSTLTVNPTASPTKSPTPTAFSVSGSPTRTLTPTRTPTATPRPGATATATPIPTLGANEQQMTFKVKLAGVTDGSANGAKIQVKFDHLNGTITQMSQPLVLSHAGGDVYQTTSILASPIPAASKLRIKIKGEKHVAVAFCRQTGQTTPCTDGQFITIPSTTGTMVFDFTGIPLPPGDLGTQDGQANAADLDKLTPLMGKVCANLTAGDKLVGDVDYNGCINVRDVFLILQTLETRYDE